MASLGDSSFVLANRIVRPLLIDGLTMGLKRKHNDSSVPVQAEQVSKSYNKSPSPGYNPPLTPSSLPPSQVDPRKQKKVQDLYDKLGNLEMHRLILRAEASVGYENIVRVPLAEALNVMSAVTKSAFNDDEDDDAEQHTDIAPPPPPYLHPYDNTQLAAALFLAKDKAAALDKALDPSGQIAERKRRKIIGAYRLAGISNFVFRTEKEETLVVRLDVADRGKYVDRYHVFFELVSAEVRNKDSETSKDSKDDDTPNSRQVMFRMSQHTLPPTINVKEVTERHLGQKEGFGLHKVDPSSPQVTEDLFIHIHSCVTELYNVATAHSIRVCAGKRLEQREEEEKLRRVLKQSQGGDAAAAAAARDSVDDEAIKVVHSEGWDLVSFRMPCHRRCNRSEEGDDGDDCYDENDDKMFVEIQLAYDVKTSAVPSRIKCKFTGLDFVDGGEGEGGRLKDRIKSFVEETLLKLPLDEGVPVLRQWFRCTKTKSTINLNC